LKNDQGQMYYMHADCESNKHAHVAT